MQRDTWPDRVGVSVLLDAQSRIDWVRGCLDTQSDIRQIKAEASLKEAMTHLDRAIAALRE